MRLLFNSRNFNRIKMIREPSTETLEVTRVAVTELIAVLWDTCHFSESSSQSGEGFRPVVSTQQTVWVRPRRLSRRCVCTVHLFVVVDSKGGFLALSWRERNGTPAAPSFRWSRSRGLCFPSSCLSRMPACPHLVSILTEQ